MILDDRRQPRVWVAVAATALVLLAFILITVILLADRLRQPGRVTVVQPPAGTATPAATAPSATAGWRGTQAPAQGREPAKVVEGRVKIVEQPVKVVEKQVKVVQKEVHVIEKPAASAAPAAPARGGASESRAPRADRDTFQQTGLPNQITYAGKTWNASVRMKGLPADLLADDPHRVDGRTVFHDYNASAPYAHVYLKQPGQTDQYVRYGPTTP
jgi:hypothetical protein